MSDTQLAAVIFDVDGTLVDSERDGHRVAFNQAFETVGLVDRWDVRTYGRLLETTGGERRLREYLGQPRSSLAKPVDAAVVDDLASELHRLKTGYFNEMVSSTLIPARKGVARLLDELRDADVPLAIATTGSAEWVRPLLDTLFGLQRFAVIVTGEDVERAKPFPDAYRLAVERLGLGEPAPGGAAHGFTSFSAEGVVAIEDSGPGLASALSAGIACVVVANSYTELHQVNDADVLIDGFGTEITPANVLADRYGVLENGRVDLAGLRRLAIASRA